MIRSPSSGCVSMIARSSAVRRPGFERISLGMPILPMSWSSAPSSSRFSARSPRPSSRPTRSARSVIQRACDDVYSSFASSAFASASTVETKRPLEPLVVRRVRDRELRLMGEAAEQPELALAEVALAGARRRCSRRAVPTTSGATA